MDVNQIVLGKGYGCLQFTNDAGVKLEISSTPDMQNEFFALARRYYNAMNETVAKDVARPCVAAIEAPKAATKVDDDIPF